MNEVHLLLQSPVCTLLAAAFSIGINVSRTIFIYEISRIICKMKNGQILSSDVTLEAPFYTAIEPTVTIYRLIANRLYVQKLSIFCPSI